MYILLFAIKSYTWWVDLHQVKFMLDAFLIDVTASACSGGGVLCVCVWGGGGGGGGGG